MEHTAVAYLANRNLIIAPVVRTTAGIGLEVEPSALGNSPDEDAIADALSRALARSARIVPHPAQKEWKGFFQPFEEAAGVRSYKAFMKDAQRVGIRAIEGKLELTPELNLGSKEGFESIPERAVFVSRDDPRGAAAILLELLGLNVRPS